MHQKGFKTGLITYESNVSGLTLILYFLTTNKHLPNNNNLNIGVIDMTLLNPVIQLMTHVINDHLITDKE